MTDRKALDSDVYDALLAHFAEGDAHAESGAFEAAIRAYEKAWALIPEPKSDWNASTTILAAIADAAFLAGELDTARRALAYAMTCPDAVGNPFLHLRYGEVLLDLGEDDAAANELIRAYMAEGEQIFSEEDPRYFNFLKTRANI